MIVFNKQTVEADQWLENLKEKAEKENNATVYNQMRLTELIFMFNDGMNTDEALLEIKKRSQDSYVYAMSALSEILNQSHEQV
jgi:uncharacterized membrane protein